MHSQCASWLLVTKRKNKWEKMLIHINEKMVGGEPGFYLKHEFHKMLMTGSVLMQH